MRSIASESAEVSAVGVVAERTERSSGEPGNVATTGATPSSITARIILAASIFCLHQELALALAGGAGMRYLLIGQGLKAQKVSSENGLPQVHPSAHPSAHARAD